MWKEIENKMLIFVFIYMLKSLIIVIIIWSDFIWNKNEFKYSVGSILLVCLYFMYLNDF